MRSEPCEFRKDDLKDGDDKVKKEPLYLKIYKDLIQGIQDGTHASGSRLPSEKELADQYKVSRITSKKALEMLADKNIITRRPGKGSYVLGIEEGPAEPESRQSAKMEGPDKIIGVVMDAFGATYGTGLLSGIEHECRRKGFNLVLKCTYGSIEAETEALEDLRALGVSGIILMCAQGETYNAAVLRLSVERFPIVLVDRELKGLPIPFVGTDNYSAAKELMDLLIEKGHTNICFLSHPFVRTSTVKARFSGYRDSYLEHNMLTNEREWITDIGSVLPCPGENEDTENEDVTRIESYIEQNPQVTAFFAVDYTIGVMVYKILKRMGLDQEKEIVFFDGFDGINDSNPIFTHVMQGEYIMGVKGVKYLLDRIEGKEVPETTYVPYQIVPGN